MKINLRASFSVLAFVLVAYAAYAETVNISTFYPSPYGSYQDFDVSRNSWLASNGANTSRTGIGLANNITPISRLQVNGTATVGGGTQADSNGTIQIVPVGTLPNAGRLTFGGTGVGWKFHIGKAQGGAATDYVTVQDNGATGFVGINKTSPAYNLDVEGSASINGTLRVKDTTGTNQGTLQIVCPASASGNCYAIAVYS